MSNYEFWDELGKIFNAVVAYQEKTIEFNKRFINPWIRLGNVFDKQGQNEDAISAYEKAIEIDPNNAQNWYELGNIHFRMEKYDDAVDNFNHAIDLDPGFGESYNNLALTLVTQGKYVEAIPLYRKSIDLLDEDKDIAVAWNRLGNLYRKLNEYELAVESFQKADELDKENAGFRDNLDDVSDGPTLVDGDGDGEEPAIPIALSLSELIPADSGTAEVVSDHPDEYATSQDAPVETPQETDPAIADNTDSMAGPLPEPSVEAENAATVNQPAVVAAEADQTTDDTGSQQSVPPDVEQPIMENAAEGTGESTLDTVPAPTDLNATSPDPIADNPTQADPQAIAEPDVADKGDETVTVVVQSTVETLTETVTVSDTSTETSDACLTVDVDAIEEVIDQPASTVDKLVVENSEVSNSDPTTEADPTSVVPTDSQETNPVELSSQSPVTIITDAAEIQPEVVETVVPEISSVEIATATVAEASDQETDSVATATEPSTVDQPAYEEYLKDSIDPIHIYQSETCDQTADNENNQASQEPIAKINTQGELQIEMDTKNAHVWNELGNVYFNTGAFDDAVIAYSKAIELDRWFAWPYSNLALTYVQKGRFVEAILLYQRSIELFKGDKDKAVSWNRLGNVYRRINDYENAIASYQRADELDPDNTTLSLQSRFSLLGSYVMEQKPTYVS